MAHLKITKEEIFDVMASEILWHGNWAIGCRSCLVGAILRRHGLSVDEVRAAAIEKTGNDEVYLVERDDTRAAVMARQHLNRGLYLSALSILFENGSTPNTMASLTTLDFCREFIKSEFPDHFRIQVFT